MYLKNLYRNYHEIFYQLTQLNLTCSATQTIKLSKLSNFITSLRIFAWMHKWPILLPHAADWQLSALPRLRSSRLLVQYRPLHKSIPNSATYSLTSPYSISPSPNDTVNYPAIDVGHPCEPLSPTVIRHLHPHASLLVDVDDFFLDFAPPREKKKKERKPISVYTTP